MQLHQLKRVHKNIKSRQVGRGGKRGKTSGRGTKGQKARAGNKKRPEMRDIIKKIPKLRGRGIHVLKPIGNKPAVVNLGSIAEVYKAGEKVTPISLMEKGLVRQISGRAPKVKILSGGDLSSKLSFEGVLFSISAKEKIEKAGSSIA